MHQSTAGALVLNSKTAVVTRGPGCGKTRLLDAILLIVAAKGRKILLVEPADRAAKRMAEFRFRRPKTIKIAADKATGMAGGEGRSGPELRRRSSRAIELGLFVRTQVRRHNDCNP
jgi:AAA domain